MNTNIENVETTVEAARPAAGYRPKLRFYHANAKGTGSAVSFELHPAHDDTDGSVFATFAAQRTVGSRNGEVRVFPTFDWTNAVCVKLDIMDLARILQVFRGECESIADGQGLFHRSERGVTIIKLEHRIDPVPGYNFSVSKKGADDIESRFISAFFSSAEAFALATSLEMTLAVVAFGILAVVPRAARAEQNRSRESAA